VFLNVLDADNPSMSARLHTVDTLPTACFTSSSRMRVARFHLSYAWPLGQAEADGQPRARRELLARGDIGLRPLSLPLDQLLVFVDAKLPRFGGDDDPLVCDSGDVYELLTKGGWDSWAAAGLAPLKRDEQPWGPPQQRNLAFQQDLRRWLKQGVPEQLLAGAQAAQNGRMSPELFGFLQNVRHLPHGRAEVAHYPALAAWGVDWLARLVSFRIDPCRRCGRMFVAIADQAYCNRVAPGEARPCSELGRNERFRTQRRPYRREYQRLEARNKRGRLSDSDWLAWKAENRVGVEGQDWRRYEDWNRDKEEQ